MAVIATGFFDGVHLGHRHIIETLVRCAKESDEPAIVLTFWPHPRMVLQNGARQLRLLSSLEEKNCRLRALGVDRIEILEFSKEFAAMTAEEYLKEVVGKNFCGSTLVLGYDNRLGSDQLTPDKSVELATAMGIRTVVCDPVGQISSTRIRSALAEGNIAAANEWLGYEYSIRGAVVSGKQLGRTIGFPTANMQLFDPLRMVPGRGAYLTKVRTLGKELYGMTNVGDVIETHIFDFDEDVYGLDIDVTFVDFLRHEMNFSSVEELKNQLAIDEISAKNRIFGI